MFLFLLFVRRPGSSVDCVFGSRKPGRNRGQEPSQNLLETSSSEMLHFNTPLMLIMIKLMETFCQI